MRALICHDDGQLRRVERAIAAIASAPPRYRQNNEALLEALRIERASLLQYTKRYRDQMDGVTMPVPGASDMAQRDTGTRLGGKYLRGFASMGH